ncbi:MAG: hypothetical protein L6U99_13105 [Clostridium sp.]|nr:MAG: hypothetical protein L6U99_13105 [Clostridium sp.]
MFVQIFMGIMLKIHRIYNISIFSNVYNNGNNNYVNSLFIKYKKIKTINSKSSSKLNIFLVFGKCIIMCLSTKYAFLIIKQMFIKKYVRMQCM